MIEVLNERELKLLSLRFGLDDGKPRTLEEVGDHFGLCRERVRQLQNIALSKLRRAHKLQQGEQPLPPDTVRRLLAGCYPKT